MKAGTIWKGSAVGDHVCFGRARRLVVLCVLLAWLAPQDFTAAPSATPRTRGASNTNPAAFSEASGNSSVDELCFAKLAQLRLPPSDLCTDPEFIRRIFLDVLGTLPTPPDVRAFLEDTDPNKRTKLIDRLLEREEFADFWAMKWDDLLRVKAEFPINLWPNAAQAYHRWIRTAIKENKPYDRFVRELLTESGSNFRVPQVNFYRASQSKEPQAIAEAVALTFMGTRVENWPRDQRSSLAAFFSRIGYKQTAEWKEEIVFFDPTKTNALSQTALFPDGTDVRQRAGDWRWKAENRAGLDSQGAISDSQWPARDPREAFADWLIDPKNPWFTRNIVNRVWSWLLGHGIIHEADDIRPDNPPSNPELLAFLERELIAARYDLKHLYRLILNSKTYQLSCVPKSDCPEAETNFSHYLVRRLEAEVLMDALNQVTGTTERYSSAIPEPFTFIPEDQPSIALPDGSITSPFLELFGRPARDTGLESERNNRPTAAQRLHLLNSSHIQRKIEQSPKLRFLTQSRNNSREIVTGLYLLILSRYPTEEELKIAAEYSQSGTVTSREAVVDLVWALINSAEFLYRH